MEQEQTQIEEYSGQESYDDDNNFNVIDQNILPTESDFRSMIGF